MFSWSEKLSDNLLIPGEAQEEDYVVLLMVHDILIRKGLEHRRAQGDGNKEIDVN